MVTTSLSEDFAILMRLASRKGVDFFCISVVSLLTSVYKTAFKVSR